MGTTAAPDRLTFLQGRRAGIGSSDAPMLLGISPWGGPWRVFESKVTPPPPEDTENEPARWGRMLEDLVARDWAKSTGHKILRRRRQFTSTRWPWAIANPDRWVVGEPALVEVKVVFHRAADWGDDPSEAPPHVQVQCQHQMAVTGTRWVYIPVLFAQRPEARDYLVKRNDQLITDLMEVEEDFWTNHVLTDTPPPPDASDDARRGLARRYPGEEELTLTATVELAAVVDQLLEARDLAGRADTVVQEHTNTIKAAMGQSTVLLSPSARITWKRGTRDVVDWEAVANAGITAPTLAEIAAAHTTTKPTDRFTVTPTGGSDAS